MADGRCDVGRSRPGTTQTHRGATATSGSTATSGATATHRGQTTLAGLAVALVILTTVTVGSIVAADRALSDAAAGSPLEQHRAERAADALVADSPITTDRGYVAPPLVNGTNASDLVAAVPSLRGVAFSVRVEGRTVAERGTVTDGVTVSRGVVVVENRTGGGRIDLETDAATTLDGRTDEVRFDVDPGDNTTVRTIRVNDRVVLHRPTGIEGTHVVSVSPHAPPLIRVDAEGNAAANSSGPAGTVTATATLFETRTALVEVTVDA